MRLDVYGDSPVTGQNVGLSFRPGSDAINPPRQPHGRMWDRAWGNTVFKTYIKGFQKAMVFGGGPHGAKGNTVRNSRLIESSEYGIFADDGSQYNVGEDLFFAGNGADIFDLGYYNDLFNYGSHAAGSYNCFESKL